MMEHHIIHTYFPLIQTAIVILAVILAAGYMGAMVVSGSKFKSWPVRRLLLWTLGLVTAASAFAGPVGDASHENFIAHMSGRVMLGVVAPVFIVWSKPMTVMLRTLSPD